MAGLYSVRIIGGISEEPNLIWSSYSNRVPQFITAVTDGNGVVHVVWNVNIHPNPIPSYSVRYARPEDGVFGEDRIVTKAPPLDKPNEDLNMQAPRPWVGVRGLNEIHLQWAQGPLTYRNHQYSIDGGKSWPRAARICPNFVSQTNSVAVAEDSEGNLY